MTGGARWCFVRAWPAVLTVLLAGRLASAGEGTNPDMVTDARSSSLLPSQLLWPGVVVIVVVGIFLAAAVAGPLIRANLRDEREDRGD